jgi:hypothetical protein
MLSYLKPLLFGCLFATILMSCRPNTISITSKSNGFMISGIATPFLGSIVQHQNNSLFPSSYAAVCTDPVNAQLYKLNADGTITEGLWVATQPVDSDASYSFNLKALGLSTKDSRVKYLVKVEGCNGEVYKRPITAFNDTQDITYKTSLVGNVINVDSSALGTSLNEASRVDVQKLIDKISGSSRGTVLTSLTTESNPVSAFSNIFGASPLILLDAKPEVFLKAPTTNLAEMVVAPFSVQTFHPDPSYSAAYSWKLDGVVKSTSSTWNYIPGTNDQGQHQVEIFVGKNNGSNIIDVTKPYYHRSFYVTVSNDSNPIAPAISVNTLTPSPRSGTSIDIDIDTGVAFGNCSSFTEMSLSESSTPPGAMTYTLTCTTLGTQTQTVAFTASQGTKTIYLWARDSGGNVSLPTSVSFVHDSVGPTISLSTSTTLIKGGGSLPFTYSISDSLSAISSAKVYYAPDGTTFAFMKDISAAGTSDSFTVPSDNVTTAKIRIVAVDAAGNSTTFTSASTFTVDSVLPTTPAMTLASNLYSQSKTVTMTAGACGADQAALLVNESTQPLSTDSAWQTCSTTAGAISYLIPTNTEGLHALKVWAKDPAGNVSTAAVTVNMYLDLTAPVITFGTLPSPALGGSAKVLPFSITELHTSSAQTLSIEFYDGTSWGAPVAKSMINGPLSSSAFTHNFTAPSLDTAGAKFRITYADLSGRSTTVTSTDLLIDITPPTLSTFSINSGATTATNNNVQIAFAMNDTISNIAEFCLKYNTTTAPAAGDSCWRAVNASPPALTPAKTLNLANYYWSLGIGAASYTVYGWVKDGVGLMSSLTASGVGTAGTDKATIDYNPGTPPVTTDVLASNKDNPTNPPDRTTDLVATAASTIIIKWKATDVEGLTSTPISISYSTDDVNYTTIESNLLNGQNGSCTINNPSTTADDTATGCYAWSGANPGTYFKIKVVTVDTAGQASSSVSVPLNSGYVNFLAGNTDMGLNGSASSAIFQNWIGSDAADNGSFAITPSGDVYFIDPNRGLLKVKATDGLVKLWIPKTFTVTGNGVNITSATLCSPHRLALTYNNTLLIRDCNVIREIDLATNIITTKIGGGASTADGVSPLQVSLATHATSAPKTDILTPLPNGDILFTNDTFSYAVGVPVKFRRYIAASDTVTSSIALGGTGLSGNATQDLSLCSFTEIGIAFDSSNSTITQMLGTVNLKPAQTGCTAAVATTRGVNFDASTGLSTTPVTPTINPFPNGDVFTGLDGRLYVSSRNLAKIYRYSLTPTGVSADWQLLVGTGIKGVCANGTAATSCAIDLSATFVTALGRVYFTDRGLIRFIDESGNVQTLMGQRYSFGDGGLARSARFGVLDSVAASNSGEIIINDYLEARIRAFTPGGTISTLAGNGFNQVPTLLTNASTQSISVMQAGANLSNIHVEPSTGDVYYMPDSIKVSRLDRTLNQWINIIGQGTTYYPSADGLTGANVQTNNSPRNKITAYDPVSGKIFVEWKKDSGLGYAVDNMINSYDKATSWTQTHWIGQTGQPDGVCVTDSTLSENCTLPYNPSAQYDANANRMLMNYEAAPRGIYSVKPGFPISLATTLQFPARAWVLKRIGSDDWIYYCDSVNSVLRKQRIGDTTSTALTWPSTSVKCAGTKSSLRWHPVTGNLIFIYTQDNLYGVAEYVNP